MVKNLRYNFDRKIFNVKYTTAKQKYEAHFKHIVMTPVLFHLYSFKLQVKIYTRNPILSHFFLLA